MRPEDVVTQALAQARHLQEFVTYHVPKDKEILLFDFYVAAYLSTLNLSPEVKGYTGSFTGPEGLEQDISHAFETITSHLKKDLLDATFWSIGCEVRHFRSKLSRSSQVALSNNFPLFVKFDQIYNAVRSRSADIEDQREKSHLAIRRSIAQEKTNELAFVNMAMYTFGQYGWTDGYGGEAWEAICEGWINLYQASTPRDVAVWIDHIYDLEHNSDTVFDKVESYSKNGGHDWLATALEFKANVKSIHELLPFCSSDMKKLAQAALKSVGVAKPGSKLKHQSSTDQRAAPLAQTWIGGIWKGGIWTDGEWKSGTWMSGTWINGTWRNGQWKNGTWANGTWVDGEWHDGTWKNGVWFGGTWYDGDWENGTWKSGTRRGGDWYDGRWLGGDWRGGSWLGGTWENGTWISGVWQGGTWIKGKIYDPLKGKYVNSKVSPAEYFKKSSGKHA